MKLDKWIKMVNFKLGNEMWKVNWSTSHECGSKKNSEPPTGIKPMTSRALYTLSYTEERIAGEKGHLTELICDRRPAYC